LKLNWSPASDEPIEANWSMPGALAAREAYQGEMPVNVDSSPTLPALIPARISWLVYEKIDASAAEAVQAATAAATMVRCMVPSLLSGIAPGRMAGTAAR
jgi:hypothetical protein